MNHPILRIAAHPPLSSSSCLLKLYLYEADSDRNTAILRRQTTPVTTSILGETEFAFAVARREADGSIGAGAAGERIQLFQRHCGEGRIQLAGLAPGIRELAASLARRFHLEENPSLPLRTLDGLHLATALVHRSRRFVTVCDNWVSNRAASVQSVVFLRPGYHR